MTQAPTAPSVRLPDWLRADSDPRHALHELERLWVEVDRTVPPTVQGESRLLYEFAHMMFEGKGQRPASSSAPEALQSAYDALQDRWLVEPDLGRARFIGAIRQQVLHADRGAPESARMLPREARFTAEGLCYHDIRLRIELPPFALDAHLGDACVYREDPPRLLARFPVPELTGYKRAAHSIEALGRLHRFSRGHGTVDFGDWFNPDGFGRELAAAMVAGLVTRSGEFRPNGLGGVSPVYELTPAGQAWVIQQPGLASLFDHCNGIDQQTAFLEGSDGTVPFDIHTGAVLGLYGDPERAPLYVDVAQCAVSIEAGQTYDVLGLAYHAVGGRYETPAQHDLDEASAANAPGM